MNVCITNRGESCFGPDDWCYSYTCLSGDFEGEMEDNTIDEEALALPISTFKNRGFYPVLLREESPK